MHLPAVSSARRAPLIERLRACRARTLELISELSAEDCAAQSMPDASPAKWHLAHTTWFFETFVLAKARADYQPFSRDFGYLFNSYYEVLGPRHCRDKRGALTRPALGEIVQYRAWVEAELEKLLLAGAQPFLLPIIELGLQHEEQHQELILTDIKHLFSLNPMAPSYARAISDDASIAACDSSSERGTQTRRWVRGPQGVQTIGFAGEGFCFDNERPKHRVFLEPYDLGSHLVTSGEYRAFIEDGGYARPELWLSDGWAACQRNGWTSPLYWHALGRSWEEHTLRGRRPLVDDAPVCHVSYYEADAFARWSGARLPTEAEWEAVALDSTPGVGGFLESGRLHPRAAVGAVAGDGGDARSAAAGAGLAASQMFGEVWQWTSSAYAAYPGFRPFEGDAGEYNGKFMCNQFVLRGGSCVSPAAHIRSTYRNFFGPEARWQFSGIRLARGAA